MMRSGLILAGGEGSRLEYAEKALIPFGKYTLIEHIIDTLENSVDDVIISVRDEIQKQKLKQYVGNRTIVTDKYKGVGPLAGILEGFKVARSEYVFVVACDMPLINTDVVDLLFEYAEGHDAALPQWEDGNLEPLHAVYRVYPLVFEIEKTIKRNDRFVLAPVYHLDDIVYLNIEKIKKLDTELETFLNINTIDDLENMIKRKT